MDAAKLNGSAKSYRHSYYKNNNRTLIIWQLILLGVGIVILFYIPIKVIYGGVVVLLSIGIYFLIIFIFSKSNLIFREVVVAIGYTLAVTFVPFIGENIYLEARFYWILVIVFLIALVNLWVFSIYDVEIDQIQNHHSIARTVSVGYIKKLSIIIIILAFLVTLVFSYWYNLWLVGISLIIAEIVYLLLLEKQSYFKHNEYYRLVGETVLMLPGAVILIYNAI